MTDTGYTLASLLARRLPRRAADVLAESFSDFYVLTHPGRARAVDSNLAWIWAQAEREGPAPRARATYRTFARAVRDFLAHDGAQAGEAPRVLLAEGAEEALARARASGRGTVIVSGHFGPWERALQWLASELGGVDALAAPHRFPAVERFFVRRRAAFGVRTLCDTRPVQTALQNLRSGGWIAALADRPRRPATLRSEAGNAIVSLDCGPLVLARRARAQVLPGVSRFTADGGYEVRLEQPFSLDPGSDGITLAQARDRLQQFFDEHVRTYPTQWFAWGQERRARSAVP